MRPWPDEQSVIVLDNCRIHHNETLLDLVRAAGGFLIIFCAKSAISSGCLLLYLPAYSPDLNLVEESFSCCSLPCLDNFLISTHIYAVKAHLRRYGRRIRRAEDAITTILEECGCITAELARGWFEHAGYIW
jgi:transposase